MQTMLTRALTRYLAQLATRPLATLARFEPKIFVNIDAAKQLAWLRFRSLRIDDPLTLEAVRQLNIVIAITLAEEPLASWLTEDDAAWESDLHWRIEDGVIPGEVYALGGGVLMTYDEAATELVFQVPLVFIRVVDIVTAADFWSAQEPRSFVFAYGEPGSHPEMEEPANPVRLAWQTMDAGLDDQSAH